MPQGPGGGKGGSPGPQPTAGGKVVSFTPYLQVYPGDCITAASPNGWHVVTKYHSLPATPYQAGSSNDFVHWSYGAAGSGN